MKLPYMTFKYYSKNTVTLMSRMHRDSRSRQSALEQCQALSLASDCRSRLTSMLLLFNLEYAFVLLKSIVSKPTLSMFKIPQSRTAARKPVIAAQTLSSPYLQSRLQHGRRKERTELQCQQRRHGVIMGATDAQVAPIL